MGARTGVPLLARPIAQVDGPPAGSLRRATLGVGGSGRWSTGGQFEKSDFGGWREIWTVGGKLASPAIQFSVNAPCLPGGQGQSVISGPNIILSCETTEGTQTFVTPSLSDPFRTPDGRLIPGRRTEETPGQYHTGIIQDLIAGGTEMR